MRIFLIVFAGWGKEVVFEYVMYVMYFLYLAAIACTALHIIYAIICKIFGW